MTYRIIDFDTWNRKPHFELFDVMDHPWLDIALEIDATNPWLLCGTNGGPSFFAASLFLATSALNRVEEFRMRIRDSEIIIHDQVSAGSTVMRDDETFGFGFFPASENFPTFAAGVAAEVERVRIQNNELVDRDIDDVIHFSVVPWLNFTAIGHPRHRNKAYSIPKIVFGRCHQQDSKWMLPMTVSAHHGLVDGLHIARFVDQFQQRCHNAGEVL